MAYKISLNGANYVSAAREKAFEEALADSGKGLTAVDTTAAAVHNTASAGDGLRTGSFTPGASTSADHNGNGHDRTPVQAAAAFAVPETALSGPNKVGAPQVAVKDYGRVLEGLERGLAQSYDHQSEMLRVHQQYLSNQASYADIFAALMQEQGALFTAGNTTGERAEVLLQVLQSLNRSVAQFHTHQSETLDLHGQFLQQQASYAQAFIELLQSHYGAALSANGNGHSHGNGQGYGHNGADGHRHSDAGHRDGHARVESASAALTVSPSRPAMAPQTASIVRETQAAPSIDRSQPDSQVLPAAFAAAVEPGIAVATSVQQQASSAAFSAGELSAALLDIVSDKTGYPAEMLDLDMDMEADLGIDSIKRVEILGALQDAYPGLPDVETDILAELRTLAQILDYMSKATSTDPVIGVPTGAAPSSSPNSLDEDALPVSPAAAPTGTVDVTVLSQELLEIVSDKTGYPAEMLELDMDMEADLGIDSIKRVEILGSLQDRHPDLPEVETDVLAELRTLAQILNYMAHDGGNGDHGAEVGAAVRIGDPKKV